MEKAVVRLHLFFASENDTAVILRQGPTKQFRLIHWHRDSDTFEDGKWLKRKVYVERCDLSPSGRHDPDDLSANRQWHPFHGDGT